MDNIMQFPETFEEFAKSYGFKDSKEIYTNGSDLIPVFRVEQWLEHALAERTCHAVFDDSNWYKWICSECGQPIDRADNYCFSCGAKVVE